MVTLTRLKLLRERKALTQQALADRAGLNRTTVARLEGGRDQPFPTTVQKLSKALDVEPAELIGSPPPSFEYRNADPAAVRRFVDDHPDAGSLIDEATEQIARYFPGARLHIETQVDPEYGGDEELFIGIVTELLEDEAEEALKRFDDEWWLRNARRSNGSICIDLFSE